MDNINFGSNVPTEVQSHAKDVASQLTAVESPKPFEDGAAAFIDSTSVEVTEKDDSGEWSEIKVELFTESRSHYEARIRNSGSGKRPSELVYSFIEQVGYSIPRDDPEIGVKFDGSTPRIVFTITRSEFNNVVSN